MTQSDIQISDRTSVPPKADVRVATAVPPTAVATPNSVVAKSLRGASAPCERSSLDLAAVSSGIAALSFEDEISALEQRAFAPVSVKNVSTFLVAASSAIHSPVSTTSIPTT